MVTIKTINEESSTEEILQDVANRVGDAQRIYMLLGMDKDDLEPTIFMVIYHIEYMRNVISKYSKEISDAAKIRMLQIHYEELEKEISILKARM